MRTPYELAIRYPRATILAGVLVTLAVAPGMLRLRLRTDGHALVPAEAPAVQADQRIRHEFGLDDPVVVVIRPSDPAGIFNFHTVRLIDQLTTAFQDLQGVRKERVLSLATEASDRVWPGTLKFRRLLEPLPKTQADLVQLRKDLREIQLYAGTFASKNGKAAAIMVGVPSGEDRLGLLQRIQQTVASLGPMPERIDIIGAPVAEALLGTHILEDLGVPSRLLGFSTFGEAAPSDRHAERSEASPVLRGKIEPEILRSAQNECLERMRRWIARHIGLVPVAIIVIAAVFFVCFRSVAAAALPLMEVGAALVFVFGLMGLLDVPIYLTTAVLPIILTATGITDEIHVFSRYRHLLAENPDQDHVAIVGMTMAELSRPIVMTSVTTAIGFLSFAFSSIKPVQAFGLFTGVGNLFCMLWSISVVPACFVLLSPRHFISARRRLVGGPSLAHSLLLVIGRAVVRGRYVVLILAIAAVALLPSGIRRVVIQDSWIDGFAESSDFYEATQRFNDDFLGMHVLLLAVDAGRGKVITGELPAANVQAQSFQLPIADLPSQNSVGGWRVRLERTTPPGPSTLPSHRQTAAALDWSGWIDTAERQGDHWLLTIEKGRPPPGHMMRLQEGDIVRYELSPVPFMQPVDLDRIADLEQFIRGRSADAVGGVLGPTDYVKTVNYMIRGRKADQLRVPPDAANVERAWREYGNVRGEDRLGQLVDSTFTRGIVTILLKNANFVDTGRLMAAIRDYEDSKLSPHGISLTFAGDVAVSQTLIEAIVRTETQSLAGTMLGVLLVTVILGRSLVFGLLCIIPSTLAVLANFAVMGWAGMPLGVATSMFSAMTIGIGVDYAIHLQSRYRRLRKQPRSHEATKAGTKGRRDEGTEVPSGEQNRARKEAVETAKSQEVEKSKEGLTGALSIVDCRLPTEDSSIARSPDHQFAKSGDDGSNAPLSPALSPPLDRRKAIAAAVAGTGPAIVVDTLAVALGFGILTLSQVPANARLGALVALSIVNCVLATLLVLPAMLAIRSPAGK